MSKPEVSRYGLLAMQVCVPKDFTDAQVESFANGEYPTGIDSKWNIRRQGSDLLNGCDERVQCQQAGREDCCHIMLDC